MVHENETELNMGDAQGNLDRSDNDDVQVALGKLPATILGYAQGQQSYVICLAAELTELYRIVNAQTSKNQHVDW